MTAPRHGIAHQPVRVDWHAIGTVLADIHDALWKSMVAAFWSLLAASAFGLMARGLKEEGQWAAGVMTIVIGFTLITLTLLVWAERQTMTKPVTGHQSCPWCGQVNVRLTTRVIGHPRPGIVTLADAGGVDVCGDCTPKAIATACKEHDFSAPMIQVLPIKRVVVSMEDRRAIAREVAEDRTRDAAGLE